MILFICALFAAPAAYLLQTEGNSFFGGSNSPDFKAVARERSRNLRDSTGVRVRLSEIGKASELEYEKFRLRQLSLMGVGTLTMLLISLMSGSSLISSFLFCAIAACAVYFLLEKELTSQVKKHRQRIEAEFPAIVEMLTLALSAGETPLSAMKRVAVNAHGALANEFSRVVAAVHTGTPFHLALDEMGRRTQSILIRRFVDALVTAMLRGAPLIDVLQRHAMEARENQRNRIMNAAGKAEISMMIPVVFLILPISILFALWPSLSNLNLFAT